MLAPHPATLARAPEPQGRTGARAAAAWPHRRRDSRAAASPVRAAAADLAAAQGCVLAGPTTEQLPRAAARAAAGRRRRGPLGLAPARRRTPRCVRCRVGKKPLPLTSGARWSVG